MGAAINNFLDPGAPPSGDIAPPSRLADASADEQRKVITPPEQRSRAFGLARERGEFRCLARVINGQQSSGDDRNRKATKIGKQISRLSGVGRPTLNVTRYSFVNRRNEKLDAPGTEKRSKLVMLTSPLLTFREDEPPSYHRFEKTPRQYIWLIELHVGIENVIYVIGVADEEKTLVESRIRAPLLFVTILRKSTNNIIPESK